MKNDLTLFPTAAPTTRNTDLHLPLLLKDMSVGANGIFGSVELPFYINIINLILEGDYRFVLIPEDRLEAFDTLLHSVLNELEYYVTTHGLGIFVAGQSIKDIARDLKLDYNYVKDNIAKVAMDKLRQPAVKQRIADLFVTQIQVSQLSGRVSSLMETNARLEESKARLTDELYDFLPRVYAAEDEVADLKIENAHLEDEANRLEDENSILKDEVEEVNASYGRLLIEYDMLKDSLQSAIDDNLRHEELIRRMRNAKDLKELLKILDQVLDMA